MQWISTKVRLPEEEMLVLIWGKCESAEVGYHPGIAYMYKGEWQCGFYDLQITHWAYIEPPHTEDKLKMVDHIVEINKKVDHIGGADKMINHLADARKPMEGDENG